MKTVLATPTSPPEPDDTQDDPDDAGYGEAIIVRDPDTGELSAIHPSDLDAEAGVFDSRLDQHNLPSSNSGKTSHEVVKQLEASAFAPRHKKKKPPQSTGEREWIERMVQKYGDGKDGSDSVRMMQRDKKLNVWQYSEGEIRRRLKRWQEGKAGPTDGNEELEGVEGDVG